MITIMKRKKFDMVQDSNHAATYVVQFRDMYWKHNRSTSLEGNDDTLGNLNIALGQSRTVHTYVYDPSAEQNMDDLFCLAIVELVQMHNETFLADPERDADRCIALYANQLTPQQKYRLFERLYRVMCDGDINEHYTDNHITLRERKFVKIPDDTVDSNAFKFPKKLTPKAVASLVYENGIAAVTSMDTDEVHLTTTVFYNTSNFAAPFMFAVDADTDTIYEGDGDGDRPYNEFSRACLLTAFLISINNDRSCGWFTFRSKNVRPTLAQCGFIEDKDPLVGAIAYIKEAEVYHLEKVPRVFLSGLGIPIRSLATLYSGHTTIHGEYLRYCDPYAVVDRPSVADAAVHKSMQLYCLIRTINSGLTRNVFNFRRQMAAKAQRLFSDEDGLLQIMRLMRTMQVDTEFDRYFQVPDRTVHRPQAYSGIVSGGPVSNDSVWAGDALPLGSLAPAPRII